MGISWLELMVVAVVALVVIGPKDLPAALRTLGRSLRAVRRMAGEFQSQVDQVIHDPKFEKMRREIEDAIQEVGKPSAKGKVEPAGQSAGSPQVRVEPGPVAEEPSIQGDNRKSGAP